MRSMSPSPPRHKGTVILPKGFDTNDLMDAIEAELAETNNSFNT